MKKFLIVLALFLMVGVLCGCQEKPKEPEVDVEPVAGGWVKAEDGTITPELQEIFDKAKEQLLGVDYVPVELLETQIVAGMNYKFLCDATVVYPGAETKQAIVTVYKDLEGNVEVLNVEELGGGADDTAYTEDMFDMSFEAFDSIEFDMNSAVAMDLSDAYGLWHGTLVREPSAEIHDRELCFVRIYEQDGKVVMDVTPQLREEDEHISETDHHFDTFIMEEGTVPTFRSGGMVITFGEMLKNENQQFILGGMEIAEIGESSSLKLYR